MTQGIPKSKLYISVNYIEGKKNVTTILAIKQIIKWISSLRTFGGLVYNFIYKRIQASIYQTRCPANAVFSVGK